MKRILLIINMLLGVFVTTDAQDVVDAVAVPDFFFERNGKYLAVGMDMQMPQLKVKSDHAVLLTPRLVNGRDSLELPSIGIYGRQRYYYYMRNGESLLTGSTETSYRAKERPSRILYNKVMDYESWMDGAELYLVRQDYGCCGTLLNEEEGCLGKYVPYSPALIYLRPEAELEKMRHLDGSAYIDFVVDKTDIRPEYRRNVVELAKIRATIDSVRLDKDITIKGVWLKGFASPESPYSHNTELAIGRTAAVKKYIQQLYQFDEDIITTDHEPEDWAGLRRFVEGSGLEHRDEIIALIDSDMDPDRKEHRIRATYPEEYRFMLKEYYPALRHTDYRIEYTIRTFIDVQEIKQVMATQPQKLSLNEFFVLAQIYQPGTHEHTEVFETAVRMYPNDPTANLNAANIALQEKNWDAAERYLAKAGETPQAAYARGVLAFHKEDYEVARQYFLLAQQGGVAEAEVALKAITDKE